MGKKIILLLVFVLCVMSVPMVVNASNSDEIIEVIGESEFYTRVVIGSSVDESHFSTSGFWYQRLPMFNPDGIEYHFYLGIEFGSGLSDLHKEYISCADSVDVQFNFYNPHLPESYSNSIVIESAGTDYCDALRGGAYAEMFYDSGEKIRFVTSSSDCSTWGDMHPDVAHVVFWEPNFTFEPNIEVGLFDHFYYYVDYVCLPFTNSVPYLWIEQISATVTCHYADSADKVFIVNQQISNQLGDIQNGIDTGFDQMGDKLDGVQDSINQGIGNVTQKQDTIIDKISSGFANIGNQVKKAVTDAVTELFVPSEEDMVAQYDKWDSLMADRFGAVYESSQIIDDFVESIKVSETQDKINFPVVSVDLVGTTFEFGGWEVDVVPDGFQWLVDILKMVSNVGCTVLFIDGMRSRYESVVK